MNDSEPLTRILSPALAMTPRRTKSSRNTAISLVLLSRLWLDNNASHKALNCRDGGTARAVTIRFIPNNRSSTKFDDNSAKPLADNRFNTVKHNSVVLSGANKKPPCAKRPKSYNIKINCSQFMLLIRLIDSEYSCKTLTSASVSFLRCNQPDLDNTPTQLNTSNTTSWVANPNISPNKLIIPASKRLPLPANSKSLRSN